MQTEKVFPLWVWGVYLILFSLSIPWYLPSRINMLLIIGLPLWLVACMVAIVIMAFFTLWIIAKYWKDQKK